MSLLKKAHFKLTFSKLILFYSLLAIIMLLPALFIAVCVLTIQSSPSNLIDLLDTLLRLATFSIFCYLAEIMLIVNVELLIDESIS
jgi:hypothetical protein